MENRVEFDEKYLHIYYGNNHYEILITKKFSMYENLVVNATVTNATLKEKISEEELQSEDFAQKSFSFGLLIESNILTITENCDEFILEISNGVLTTHSIIPIDQAKFIYEELKKEIERTAIMFDKESKIAVFSPYGSWVFYNCTKTTYTRLPEKPVT